eukprot:600875_1
MTPYVSKNKEYEEEQYANLRTQNKNENEALMRTQRQCTQQRDNACDVDLNDGIESERELLRDAANITIYASQIERNILNEVETDALKDANVECHGVRGQKDEQFVPTFDPGGGGSFQVSSVSMDGVFDSILVDNGEDFDNILVDFFGTKSKCTNRMLPVAVCDNIEVDSLRDEKPDVKHLSSHVSSIFEATTDEEGSVYDSKEDEEQIIKSEVFEIERNFTFDNKNKKVEELAAELITKNGGDTHNEGEVVHADAFEKKFNETIDNVLRVAQMDRETTLSNGRKEYERETGQEPMDQMIDDAFKPLNICGTKETQQNDNDEACDADSQQFGKEFAEALQIVRDVSKVNQVRLVNTICDISSDLCDHEPDVKQISQIFGRIKEAFAEEARDEFLDLYQTCVNHKDSDSDYDVRFDLNDCEETERGEFEWEYNQDGMSNADDMPCDADDGLLRCILSDGIPSTSRVFGELSQTAIWNLSLNIKGNGKYAMFHYPTYGGDALGMIDLKDTQIQSDEPTTDMQSTTKEEQLLVSRANLYLLNKVESNKYESGYGRDTDGKVKEMELEIERSTQENGNSMNVKEKEESLEATDGGLIGQHVMDD